VRLIKMSNLEEWKCPHCKKIFAVEKGTPAFECPYLDEHKKGSVKHIERWKKKED